MKSLSAVAFLLIVLSGCAGAGLRGDQVAKVNGVAITRAQMETRQQIYELFFRQSMGDAASREHLIDQLITEQVLVQQAEARGITVTDAQVASEMERFFSSLDRQYEGREAVLRELASRGLTNDAIAAFLRRFLVTQEVTEQKKAEATVGSDEVTAFYDQNKQLFTMEDEAVRAAHVLVAMDQPELAQQISAKAKAGGDFAQLARLYSVDPGTSRVGGDLGYFTRAKMVPEFSEAAFRLSTGEVSDPVQTKFGWHVIRLLDKRGPGLIPLEQARSHVVNLLLPTKQDQLYEQWVASLRQQARIQRGVLSRIGP